MKKRLLTLALCGVMVLSLAASGSVYYLNFKPEQDGDWQELAKLYTQETGVEGKVQTAASGQYETTLMSEMAKTEAPTLFQVNGPVGLANWKDYCYDLSGSALAGELASDDFALMDGGSMSGIACVIETYGIIVNTKLLGDAGYSLDDIKSFADLKKVAEDITARSKELGFSAFTSAGMDGSSDWRFKTHLANLPIYFEYEADGIGDTEAIKGTYLDNYRAIWDLYINNGTCAPTLLSAKTGDDAVAEFVTEQAVFYQNGTWAYGDVIDVGEENLGMLPIYIGVGDEANQGLCTGTENYWCVNKNASPEGIQATLDFMYWCVSSDTGLEYMCSGDHMGFVIPFKGNLESTNLLVNIANDYVSMGTTSIKRCFPTMPSEEWKNVLGYALQLCRERMPMGILFLGGDVEMFAAKFGGIGVPCVLLTNTARELGFENLSSLTTDDGEAASQVIGFLAEQGHRQIGILGGNWSCSQISCRRLKGCERSFARLGLPFDRDRQCEPCRYSMGEVYAATLRLLDRCPDLTAIFAMSDVMAMGTVRALRDRDNGRRRQGVRGLPERRGPVLLADPAGVSHQFRGLALSVLLLLRRKPLFHRPGGPGGGGTAGDGGVPSTELGR